MALRFIADENVPFKVVEALRGAGYEVATMSETAHSGMRNDDLAKLCVQLGLVLMTRDADFTRLKRSLMKEVKVLYIRLGGDPNDIAQYVLDNIETCIRILQVHNVAMLDEEGCHTV